TSATDNILSITLTGAVANQFAFDNMTFCTEAPCQTSPSVTVVPDGGGLNAPFSIDAEPPGNLPFLGNALFAIKVDDAAGACPLTPGASTFILFAPNTGSILHGKFGCAPGAAGEIQIDIGGNLIVSGPVAWGGPGVGAIHDLPIPFDAGLCGITCF